MEDTDQLFDEIRQIKEQYKKEVPTVGRGWPASIRDRVKALSRLELSNREIAERTGLPIATIYIWISGKVFKRKPKTGDKKAFLPVKVKARRQDYPKVNQNLAVRNTRYEVVPQEKNYSVVLPGGIRVEQLTLEAVIELSKRMSS